MAEQKKKEKHWKKRPSWLTRWTMAGTDICICGIPIILLGLKIPLEIFVMLVVLYYYFIESIKGRSLGKMIFHVRMVDTKGRAPSKGRIAVRGALRFGVLPMMLSWRRVTLLDLLSGCRLEKIDYAPPAKKSDKKKKGKEKEKAVKMGWR